MKRTTKILTTAAAALALTASLAFAAGNSGASTPATADWSCPGAQNGQMRNGQMAGRMMNGRMPMNFEQMRAWMQSFGRSGANAPAAPATTL